jgi:hypothetical protein
MSAEARRTLGWSAWVVVWSVVILIALAGVLYLAGSG